MLILVDETGKRHYVRSEGDIHLRSGVIKRKDLRPGSFVKTHLGKRYLVLEPTISDLVQSIRGGAKPIYEYHSGMFAYLLGMGKGKTVLEAGTGSAGATIVFANTVYPGKVFSFEREKRFYDVAKKIVNDSRLDNIVLINDDVKNAGNYVGVVNSVFLDLQDPEATIRDVSRLIIPGGFLGVYTPVFDSIKPVWKEMEKQGFVGISAVSLTLGKVIVKKYVRFGQNLFGFPGFFIWGRMFGGD